MVEESLFTTNRLACRRWVATDLGDIYGVYSDEEGARWVDDGTPISLEDSKRWIDVTLENYEKRGYGMFAIIDNETSNVVGHCGLVHPGGQEEVEIKYAFYRDTWGRGYASEIVPAMLQFAASVHGIDYVIATVAAENIASQRVLLKSGMQLLEIREEDDSQTHVYEWHNPKKQ